jgi:hypothetical protein
MIGKRMSVAWAFAAAIVSAAGLAAGLAAGSVGTGDVAPIVSPDRIDDAPSAGKGSFAL